MKNTASLSRCRRYRYALWRTWDQNLPRVLFIGLNPSTADETTDDPTLVRCMNYARSWGFGGVCTGNLFAWRATDPMAMKRAAGDGVDPVGPRNDHWLQRLAAEAEFTVAAWGNHGAWRDRSAEVRGMLPTLHCLKLNRSGEPAHPLYQKADLRPSPWV